VQPAIARATQGMPSNRASVGALFTIPVICGAALLSFAHGANDVANAIGPLAAIHASISEGGIVSVARIPPWILLIGAFGIATGLLLYGPKLIRTVGSKITKLNRIRAFCVTLSAAITVIIASAMGLPVSSTHIAIGALFGVGFLREFMANRRSDRSGLDTMPLADAAAEDDAPAPDDAQRKEVPEQKLRKRYLVRRQHLLTIVAAWLVTVPASAAVSAIVALALARIGLPL
jgi:PiT family inorganic phosphate transporter